MEKWKPTVVNVLILNSACNITFYTVVWLIAVFIQWKIYNPLWWIFELPNLGMENRFFIFFFGTFWQVVQLMLITSILKQKPKEHES